MPWSVFQEPTFMQSEVVGSPELQNKVKFHELSDEDQIRNASVLVVIKYVPGSEGKTLAIIEEIHKKSQDTKIYFEIGDEYPNANFYPEEASRGDGAVILFIGSPAEERRSSSIFNKRIGAYGNMPVKTLISKFRHITSAGNVMDVTCARRKR